MYTCLKTWICVNKNKATYKYTNKHTNTLTHTHIYIYTSLSCWLNLCFTVFDSLGFGFGFGSITLNNIISKQVESSHSFYSLYCFYIVIPILYRCRSPSTFQSQLQFQIFVGAILRACTLYEYVCECEYVYVCVFAKTQFPPHKYKWIDICYAYSHAKLYLF